MRTFGKIIFSIAVIFLGMNLLTTLNSVSRNKAYSDYGDEGYLEDNYDALKQVFNYYRDDFIYEVSEDDYFIKVINGAVYQPKNKQNENFIIFFLGDKNLEKDVNTINLKITTSGEEPIEKDFQLIALSKKEKWFMQIINLNYFLNEDKAFEDIVSIELSYDKDNLIGKYEDEKLISAEDYDLITILDSDEGLDGNNILKAEKMSNLRKYRWINWVGMLSYLLIVGVLVYFVYFRKTLKARKRAKVNEAIPEAVVVERKKEVHKPEE